MSTYLVPRWGTARELDRLFDGLLRGFNQESSAYVPRLDISETDKALTVSAELPGLEDKDLEVSFDDGVLTLRGEKQAEQEEKGKRFHRVERAYGAFQRSIQLPVEVDQDKIEATFKQGVLRITLPKVSEAQRQAKRITVKAA